ncbi:hypothetical protein RL73_01690 [Liberibacter crescens]|nr:hypothetical protein RL73_01690 [Liberibacter crescens]
MSFYPDRDAALNEIHARPSFPVSSPDIVFQMTIMSEASLEEHYDILRKISGNNNLFMPSDDALSYSIPWEYGTLFWERHKEFSSWFWNTPVTEKFGQKADIYPFQENIPLPGLFMSGTRIEVRPPGLLVDEAIKTFNSTSLCRSMVANNQAQVITDFHQDEEGFTRILVVDYGMSSLARSFLVQRLIDIDVYRTLSMLCLPLIKKLSPEIMSIETNLTRVTQNMTLNARENFDSLLLEITSLAVRLEASAAMSIRRFAASVAYSEIVSERIAMISEIAVPGFETLGVFLERRMAPAMRTCRAFEKRQSVLSTKLSRVTIIIRSWVDVEKMRQSNSLLESMDRRADVQSRISRAVENFSIFAVAYYLLMLIKELSTALQEVGININNRVFILLIFPFMLFGCWYFMKRIYDAHQL